MRANLTLLIILVLNLTAWAQKTAISEIEHITIFTQGAQIERSTKIEISPGNNVIWLTGIDNNIDPNSIRISGKGDFYITQTQFKNQYIEREPTKEDSELLKKYKRELAKLSDSLRELQYEIRDLNEKYRIIQREKSLLENNPIATGKSIGDSLELLIEAVDYFREQLNEVNEISIELTRKQYDAGQVENRLNKRIAELNQLIAQIQPNNQNKVDLEHLIAVTIQTQKAQEIELDFSYFTYNAGWSVQYEISATDMDSPLEFKTQAKVWQRTNEDWQDVMLSLSTGTPTDDITLPRLNPWFISLTPPYQTNGVSVRGSRNDAEEVYIDGVNTPEADDMQQKEASYASDATQVSNNFQYVNYDIDLPYDIANDGEMVLVDLSKNELDAEFEYMLFPSREKYAFLVARVHHLSNYLRLAGEAKLYMKNTFLGNMYLDPISVPDSMDISLGKDKRISIEREMLVESTKNQIIGNDQRIDREILYRISNSYDREVELTIKEVIPRTQKSAIRIQILEQTEFTYRLDAPRGFVEWSTTAAPNSEKEQRAFIRVIFPKGEKLYGF